MKTSKTRLLQISQDLLDQLLLFRTENPGFTFSLRQRNSSRSKEKRLEEGQWFHGRNYIFIGLFSKSDTARKVKTLGFVVDFNKDGSVKDNHLTVSFRGGNATPDEINFHKALAEQLGIRSLTNNHGTWIYGSNSYHANLEDYLTRVRPIALRLLKKHSLEKQYIITQEEFLKRLNKVKEIQNKLKAQNTL